MFIDSHCHLDRIDLSEYEGDLGAAIAAAHEAGVSRMLCVGIDLDRFADVIAIARTYTSVDASVGVHPLEDTDEALSCARLVELAADAEVVAIGETGLDYYYGKDKREQQLDRFQLHLEAAKASVKPVIVHSRDAKEDTLAHIKSFADLDVGGVMHCFTEDWEMARKALDLNFYISLSGIVTFKNAQQIKEVAKQVPLDKLLIETDSPYLAPTPYRGKGNQPKYVVEVARHIAQLRGVSLEQVAETTTQNYYDLFVR